MLVSRSIIRDESMLVSNQCIVLQQLFHYQFIIRTKDKLQCATCDVAQIPTMLVGKCKIIVKRLLQFVKLFVNVGQARF